MPLVTCGRIAWGAIKVQTLHPTLHRWYRCLIRKYHLHENE